VDAYDNEPTIETELRLEMITDDGWQSHRASIADLTRNELWLALDGRLAEPLDPGRSVRLVLNHPKRPTQVAETVVLWHIGRTGNVVVLKRPRLWDSPSRRDHRRVNLSVPVYLKADENSDPMPTTSSNIGVGGLFCSAAMDLRIGQRLDVAVQLMPDRAFECQAEVARLDGDPDDTLALNLMVGLQFLDLTTDEQVSLAEDIARLAADVDANFVPRLWRPGEDELLIHVDVGPEADGDDTDDDTGRSQTKTPGCGQAASASL
jgi:hypothetical protein